MAQRKGDDDEATVEETSGLPRNRLLNSVRDAQLQRIEQAVTDGATEIYMTHASREARDRLAFYGYRQLYNNSAQYVFHADRYNGDVNDDPRRDDCVEPFMRGACCGCAATALTLLCMFAAAVVK